VTDLRIVEVEQQKVAAHLGLVGQCTQCIAHTAATRCRASVDRLRFSSSSRVRILLCRVYVLVQVPQGHESLGELLDVLHGIEAVARFTAQCVCAVDVEACDLIAGEDSERENERVDTKVTESIFVATNDSAWAVTLLDGLTTAAQTSNADRMMYMTGPLDSAIAIASTPQADH